MLTYKAPATRQMVRPRRPDPRRPARPGSPGLHTPSHEVKLPGRQRDDRRPTLLNIAAWKRSAPVDVRQITDMPPASAAAGGMHGAMDRRLAYSRVVRISDRSA